MAAKGKRPISGLLSSQEKPEIQRGQGVQLSTERAQAEEAIILPPQAAALSVPLQEIARRYISARRRSGEALLEAARWLSEARREASYGEWEVWLEAVGVDDTAARVQLQIHEAATTNPEFAERIRSGWLNLSTARELISAPEEVREQILAQEEPPTRQQIREAKRAPAHTLNDDPTPVEPAPAPALPAPKAAQQPPTPDLEPSSDDDTDAPWLELLAEAVQSLNSIATHGSFQHTHEAHQLLQQAEQACIAIRRRLARSGKGTRDE